LSAAHVAVDAVYWESANAMPIDDLVRPLLGVELFQGLKPMQITEIARRADRIVYKPGDVIVKQDTQGDAAILIVTGEAVRLAGPYDTNPRDESLPVGSLLGEMAMLIETDYASTIIARTSVRALRINRRAMQAQMAEDQSLADHLVQRISSRLSTIAQTLREIEDRLATPGQPPYASATSKAIVSQPAIH
jgi:CRP-like cAMP-binding protein